MNMNSLSTEKYHQSINLNDLCSLMNTLIQQRMNQLRLFFIIFIIYLS